MFDKLNAVEQRYEETLARLGTAELQSDPAEYRKQAKAASEMEPLVECFREYKIAARSRAETEELAAGGDREMREMAQAELKVLTVKREALLSQLKILLIPKDLNDDKNIIPEIRAGTGGDEAALVAAELFRLYSKDADRQGWRIGVISSSDTGVAGLKE